MIRNVEVTIDRSSWQGLPILKSFISASSKIQLNLLYVLWNIGLQTRPPIIHGFHLSDYWAWLRYFNAFDSGLNLRLKSEWNTLDPHQKTVASDDFGIGFSTSYLKKYHSFIGFADSIFVVNEFSELRLQKSKKRGPSKSPDFICVDSFKNIHILECKGSQSSIRSLRNSMKKGITQKRNIKSSIKNINQRLCIGTFIPQFYSTESALIHIVDPEFDELYNFIEKFDKEQLIYRIFKVIIAKQLILIGLAKTSEAFLISMDDEVDIYKILKGEFYSLQNSLNRKSNLIKVNFNKNYSTSFTDENLFDIYFSIALNFEKLEYLKNKNSLEYHIIDNMLEKESEDKYDLYEFSSELKSGLEIKLSLTSHFDNSN